MLSSPDPEALAHELTLLELARQEALARWKSALGRGDVLDRLLAQATHTAIRESIEFRRAA